MLARDLQSIVLYDQEGKFAGIRRPNSKLPIDIDGTKTVILDAIGSTGFELKTDPGAPIVYAGFDLGYLKRENGETVEINRDSDSCSETKTNFLAELNMILILSFLSLSGEECLDLEERDGKENLKDLEEKQGSGREALRVKITDGTTRNE
ncbi:hypothetical protein U1Q18_002917 [Sarracenia purpurea var. burkii]